MPRPRGSGLTVTRAVLADGTVREYCYNRYTGEKLGNNRQLALAKLAKSVGPLSAYDESINALIRDYLKSDSFLSKRGTTQGLYRHYLRLISNRFGTRHANSITFAEVDALKTELRNTPSKANMALAVLRILLGRGVKLGFCQVNTAARPGRVRQFPREQIWEVADEERFLAAASARMRLAFMLLLYTVQRPSDMLAMTRDAIIERNGRLYLTLRQQKTGTLVDIPVHRRLAETLQHDLSHASESRFLVASPTGHRWNRRNFSRAWDQTMHMADAQLASQLSEQGWTLRDISSELRRRHPQRRDLRRTGIVRMAEAGATTAQIAAVSGHAIDYCQRILDAYLPRRTEVALRAIESWERLLDANFPPTGRPFSKNPRFSVHSESRSKLTRNNTAK